MGYRHFVGRPLSCRVGCMYVQSCPSCHVGRYMLACMHNSVGSLIRILLLRAYFCILVVGGRVAFYWDTFRIHLFWSNAVRWELARELGGWPEVKPLSDIRRPRGIMKAKQSKTGLEWTPPSTSHFRPASGGAGRRNPKVDPPSTLTSHVSGVKVL